MGTAGEWRDGLCCVKVTFGSLDRAVPSVTSADISTVLTQRLHKLYYTGS